jgi:hypothetical protein
VLGCAGLFIELDPDCYASLARNYARNQRVTPLNAIETEDRLARAHGTVGRD